MLLYNTLTRRKEKFTPRKKSEVGLYTCGPTVYHYAHIGNLRTYIFSDILKRALAAEGYKVKHVMNITDVGHLTSDADEGQDKMEKGAAREQKTVWEVAEFYTKAFREDIARLNILPPSKWAKATGHIKDQIALIKKLEARGFAYEGARAVYFDTSKVPDYGKLAGLKLKFQREGAGEREGVRVEADPDKKHPSDFVLWFKRAGKYADHVMHWPSPWGEGFPGWHVECSAMSMKYLGETFDIHTGGEDHIPVHHTNEIAQSESATGKPFVRFWLHGAFLLLGSGAKMAKSGENFLTLRTMIEKGIDPMSYRYFVLGAHYRSPLQFSWEALEGAEHGLKNLYAAVSKLLRLKGMRRNAAEKTRGGEKAGAYAQEFREALFDDLNTSRCLAVLWRALKDPALSPDAKIVLLRGFDRALGLRIFDHPMVTAKISLAVRRLLEKREALRAEKDFAGADALRSEVEARGYRIEDTPEGPIVFRAPRKEEGRA